MKVRRSFSVGGGSKKTPKPRKKKKPQPTAGAAWSLKRRLAVGSGFLSCSFAVGYIFAALVVFPAPFIIRNTRVPRVTGLTVEEARDRLTAERFTGQVAANEYHPTVLPGRVIWQDPPPEVAVPEGSSVALTVSGGPALIPIPGVAGYHQALAIKILESTGLVVGSIERTQTAAPAGVVMNTRPVEGQFLPPGANVTMVVSEGSPTINVPFIVGLELDSARTLLEREGLILGTHFFRTTRTQPPGSIVEQTPAAGTLNAPGTAINVWLARERTPG